MRKRDKEGRNNEGRDKEGGYNEGQDNGQWLSMRGEFKYAWGGKEGGPGRM